MECLPLVMEPESGFYADPVVVLDFQSLYPSMIIAYNLCFCTCLGKVTPAKLNTLGVSSYSPDPNVLLDLKDEILLTPNGVMYLPSKVIIISFKYFLNYAYTIIEVSVLLGLVVISDISYIKKQSQRPNLFLARGCM